ncbi:MAG: tRNA (cytidine(56)-2'-O)-methyltransferase [Aigarchaeota archaeon]|jgi:tRNA (cytidine56-2'-O)-methyltransferase|nr:tRNA (cytidine(56)-2'-O)-methyltransferase [Candidatus Wolframiiraptor gerlachensis]
MSRITVLRLGHRIARDKRVTTHVALVARAYGAHEIIITGDRDDNLIRRIEIIVEKWGGPFSARFEDNWREVIRRFKEAGAAIIHLTMYGVNLPDIIDEIRRIWRDGKDLLVIVGGEKVPGEVYGLADYNIAVGNQPHSEVAALATFLDWLQEGEELRREFSNAKLKIIPSPRGKKVIRLGSEGLPINEDDAGH